MLDLVDETESNWVYDVLGTWMDRQIIPHEKYVVQVSRLIQVLARAGNAVFVGRGAQFLLPRPKTFAVRVVAPEAFRAQCVRQRHNVDLPEALEWVRRTDRGRHEFIQRFFHQDIDDPHLYDLVVNAERLGPAGAADADRACDASRGLRLERNCRLLEQIAVYSLVSSLQAERNEFRLLEHCPSARTCYDGRFPVPGPADDDAISAWLCAHGHVRRPPRHRGRRERRRRIAGRQHRFVQPDRAGRVLHADHDRQRARADQSRATGPAGPRRRVERQRLQVLVRPARAVEAAPQGRPSGS